MEVFLDVLGGILYALGIIGISTPVVLGFMWLFGDDYE